MQNQITKYRLRRLPESIQAAGHSRSGRYALIERGLWTPGLKIGARCVAWPESEDDTLIAAYIAGKSEREIMSLVSELVAERANALSKLRG